MFTLKSVHGQLSTLASNSGRNNKVSLLKRYLDDPLFKGVVQRALNSDTVYHVEKFPKFVAPTPQRIIDKSGYDHVFDLLDQLNSQDGASDRDKALLYLFAGVDEETHEVVKRIVQKDLKCGIGAKSVNAAMPGTIYIAPYCRCSSDKEEDKFWKKAGKKYVQLKEDGMFANIFISHKDTVTFLSRNGKDIQQLHRLAELLANATEQEDDDVLMGELLIIRNGEVLDRQTGNGILNKLIHGTAPQHEADNVAVRVWDCVPYKDFWNLECKIDYSKRLERAKNFVNRVGNNLFVDIIQTWEVSCRDEADLIYANVRKDGGEGTVLKLGNAKWADHTSPNMIKKKNVSSCALRAVSWKPGKEGSKFEDVMGAVTFESECGKLSVTINGKDDKMREENWDNNMGQIWTVEFNYVSFSKNKTTASLYLPRLSKVRPDRSKADTLKEIIDREKKKVEHS